MILKNVLLSAVAIVFASPAAMGSSAAIPQDQLLYKFPVDAHDSTSFHPRGENSYPLDVSTWAVDADAISVGYSYATCCGGWRGLNLKTGDLTRRSAHSGVDWIVKSPAAGGTTSAYAKELSALYADLVHAAATRDVLDYVDSISYLCSGDQADLGTHLADDQVKILAEATRNLDQPSVLVAYNAKEERDLLVDFVEAGHGTWLGKGRVHVPKGNGSVRVPVTLAAPISARTLGGLWIYLKLLPTGGDYSQAIAEDKAISG